MSLVFNRVARNFIKDGYFPTDEKTLSSIINWLNLEVAPDFEYQLLDPCCGEGAALADIKHHFTEQKPGIRIKTFGIEKNPQRASKAKELLDVATHADSFDMQLSQSFDLLFLNPPYGNLVADKEGIGSEEAQKRLEYQFAERFFPALRPGGLLVLIVPFSILNGAISPLIAANFTDVAVFEAPEQQFKQCVIFGRKRTSSPRQNIVDALKTFAAQEKRTGLPEETAKPYLLTPTEAKPKNLVFIKLVVDEVQAQSELERLYGSSLWPRFTSFFNDTGSHSAPPTLMEPGNWHIALMLAAGQIQGLIQSPNGQIVLIKGSTNKVRTRKTEYQAIADGKTQEVLTIDEAFHPEIRGIDLTPDSPSYGERLVIR